MVRESLPWLLFTRGTLHISGTPDTERHRVGPHVFEWVSAYLSHHSAVSTILDSQREKKPDLIVNCAGHWHFSQPHVFTWVKCDTITDSRSYHVWFSLTTTLNLYFVVGSLDYFSFYLTEPRMNNIWISSFKKWGNFCIYGMYYGYLIKSDSPTFPTLTVLIPSNPEPLLFLLVGQILPGSPLTTLWMISFPPFHSWILQLPRKRPTRG